MYENALYSGNGAMRLALGFIVGMVPLLAHAEKFTLASQSGTPTCYFVEFTKADNLAYGEFHGNKCSPPLPVIYMSGVLTRTGAGPNKEWAFSYTAAENQAELFLLNLKALTWIEYRANGGPIQIEGHGVLLKGVQTP